MVASSTEGLSSFSSRLVLLLLLPACAATASDTKGDVEQHRTGNARLTNGGPTSLTHPQGSYVEKVRRVQQRLMNSEMSTMHHKPAQLQGLVDTAYNNYKGVTNGSNADYIPYLAGVNSSLFGVAIVTVDGKVYSAGDADYSFSIQSCSKPFTLTQIMEKIGPEGVLEKIGVEPTGLPFNSILALGIKRQTPSNPLVNAGALSAVSLVKASNQEKKFKKIIGYESKLAGEELELINEVFVSEQATNFNNRGIANILFNSGYLYDEPMGTVETYTKQCSIGVTTKQLGIMGATLANGGVNPKTKKRVASESNIPYILSVMLTAGFYDSSGEWSYEVGLPGKTGVGGGIFVVVPRKLSIVAFSPPLDQFGNSVRAQLAIEFIAKQLGLNVFKRTRKNRRKARVTAAGSEDKST